MSTRTGQPGPWAQPVEYGQTDSGTFLTQFWEDVDPDKINALATEFQAQGLNYHVFHGFGKSRIEVYSSYNSQLGTEQPIDLWEYNGRATPKDLLQAATNTGITGTLTAANIGVIRAAIAEQTTYNGATLNQPLKIDDFKDGEPANALLIYTLMKSGFSDYPIRSPILRHTQTVSQLYPVTLSQLNLGKIISTSTLFALETVPAWALNGLPNIAPPSFNDGKSFAFGWYKDDANIGQIANRKVSIVQEFQYGLWPTAVFGSPL
jgi:hypothetical protein